MQLKIKKKLPFNNFCKKSGSVGKKKKKLKTNLTGVFSVFAQHTATSLSRRLGYTKSKHNEIACDVEN